VFSGEFFFSLGKVDAKFGEHFVHGFFFSFNAGIGQLDDWVHDEDGEGSLDWFTLIIESILFPFFGGWVKEVVTPEFLHQFIV